MKTITLVLKMYLKQCKKIIKTIQECPMTETCYDNNSDAELAKNAVFVLVLHDSADVDIFCI